MTTNNTDDKILDLMNSVLTHKGRALAVTDNGDTLISLELLSKLLSDRLASQERLDCINKLLDNGVYGSCYGGIHEVDFGYNVAKVHQAHRIASGGELPKRVKE